MKYLKLFETENDNTLLKELFIYLKNKGLNVKYKKRKFRFDDVITGEDYLIWKHNVYEFSVSIMRDVKLIGGQRGGDWIDKKFSLFEFEEIYNYVKNVYLENETEKYNL